MQRSEETQEALLARLIGAYQEAVRRVDIGAFEHAVFCTKALMPLARLLRAFRAADGVVSEVTRQSTIPLTRNGLYFVLASLGVTADDMRDPQATVASLFWKSPKLRAAAEAVGVQAPDSPPERK